MDLNQDMKSTETSRVETQRLHDLAVTRECFNVTSDEALAQRFGPGTHGMHELWDRVHVLNDNWHDFVIEHASCLLHADLYAEADRIGTLISRFYQMVGQKDSEASPTS